MTRGSAQQTIRKDSSRPRVVTEVDINQESELASEHFSATAVQRSASEAYDDGYLRVEHDAYYGYRLLPTKSKDEPDKG